MTVVPEHAPVRAVLVVVPARDEEERIDRCLRSVLRAVDHVEQRHSVQAWIVVAADGCVDETARSAASVLAGRGDVIVGDWNEVGTARGVGVSAGLARLGLDARDVWIANTDADCEVPIDWLTSQLAHAELGADVVLGIVTVDSFDEHPDGVEALFAHRYLLNEDGSHEHVHGANFGVRADRYVAAGGWPNLAVSEDHALNHGLISLGATIVRTIGVTVTTSGRRRGRASGGFADMLVDLGESA